jgi:serine/threonine protein kinase
MNLPIDNIVKVLGEGGFSFVYLAQDENSGVCFGVCVKVVRANISLGRAAAHRIASIRTQKNTLSNGYRWRTAGYA